MRINPAFLVILALFISPAYADVVLSSVVITPQPVEPGSDLTLAAEFTNTADSFVNNSKVVFDMRYPFALKASSEDFEHGFQICGYCNRKNVYFISVDPKSASGVYPIFIRMSSTGEIYTQRNISVEVRGKPNLFFMAEKAEQAVPGKQFSVALMLGNIGTGNAQQVKIELKSPDFIALGNSVQTLELLRSNSTQAVSFVIVPSESLKAGPYNIPFEITYRDDAGRAYNTVQQLGVRVVNEGKLDVQNIKASSSTGGSPQANEPFTVIVRIENAGSGDADSIAVLLSCSFDSEQKAFLGRLRKDEDVPAVFTFTTDKAGAHTCRLRAAYSDDLGNKTLEENFDISVSSRGPPVTYIILVIGAAGLIAYYLRRKRKAKYIVKQQKNTDKNLLFHI